MNKRTQSASNMNKQELILTFQRLLTDGGFAILECHESVISSSTFHSFLVQKGEEQTTLIVNLRNIGEAYLPNKPEIKRRQIGQLLYDDLPLNRRNRVIMLIGLKNLGSDSVLACWNPFCFVGHHKNRSCYIQESSLQKALECGVYVGEDCRTRVYACSGHFFPNLLNSYIEENAIE